MPKLLLIAGYFPPVRISSGSIRPWNMARCLIDLGWDVTVLTPQISVWDPTNLDNVEEVQKNIRKVGIKMIYTGHQLKCLAPARYSLPQGRLYWFLGGIFRATARKLGIQNWVGWVPSALHACRNLTPNDVDVIVATGAPFWGFEIAYRLSKRLRKPYIMDYRDLWTNDPWNPPSKKWVINQERRLLNKSAAITIVSPLSGEVLARRYPVVDKLHTVTNGFDKPDVQSIQPFAYDHFAIVYAGMLIPPKRSLAPLLKVLSEIRQKGKGTGNWKFHYFGPDSEEAHKEIVAWGLLQETVMHGNLPRRAVLPYLKGASLNVVLSANSSEPTLEDKGVIPGKIFELIGMEASILSIVPKGSAVANVLQDVGVESFAHDETNRIEQHIIARMNGHVTNLSNGDKYSWEELSKQYDQLLRRVISAAGQRTA